MSSFRRFIRFLLLAFPVLALTVVGVGHIRAQGLFATLTGVVSDPASAVVASAKVKLRDASSGSERSTQTDNAGYYAFVSIPVGTYILTVEWPGFTTYKAADIALGGGDQRNVQESLKVGATSETVEVSGVADAAVPVDSGEKSDTLTTKELENYVQVGSNAAEYLKIMPGLAVQNGSQNKSN